MKVILELFPTSASIAVIIRKKLDCNPSLPSTTRDVYGTLTNTGALSLESVMRISTEVSACNSKTCVYIFIYNHVEIVNIEYVHASELINLPAV